MAVSTRRSSTGSASGGGSRGSRGRRGVTRRTSITRSEGGLCSSTPISPPGAATTQVRRCCAANSARVPAGDHSPNSATARACSGSRPRAASGPMTAAASASGSRSPSGPGRPGAPGGRGVPGRASARSTVAAVSGRRPERPVVLPAAGEHGELAPLPALGVDDRELVARVELDRGDGPGLHPVPLQSTGPRAAARAGPDAGALWIPSPAGHLPMGSLASSSAACASSLSAGTLALRVERLGLAGELLLAQPGAPLPDL